GTKRHEKKTRIENETRVVFFLLRSSVFLFVPFCGHPVFFPGRGGWLSSPRPAGNLHPPRPRRRWRGPASPPVCPATVSASRRLPRPAALLALLLAAAGCGRPGAPERVWGRKGVQDGDLVRPRAAAIDRRDRLWVVDFTARIQAFDLDGQYLGVTFTT